MLRKTLTLTVVLFFTMLFVSVSIAQRQTGSIAGTITDTEGIALPGASVALKGPALMGTLSYITSDTGDFRFPSVPPGKDYVITVSITGFKTLSRGGIVVNVGRTVTLSLQLEPAELTEEVTVTAPTPAVDVTSSKLSMTYTEELIRDLPISRNYEDLIYSAPGVSEDDNYWIFRSFVAGGGTTRENQVALDGVSITDPLMATNPVSLSFDALEEYEIELGAHPAEVAKTEGAFVNMVTKSGGNKFHGHASVYFYTEGMVKQLIPDPTLEAIGMQSSAGEKNLGDFSLSLGGPIIKDRIWFFVNGRYIDWKRGWETIYDGPFDVPHDEISSFIKLSWQAHQNIKITGMWSYNRMEEPIHSYYLRGDEWYRTDLASIWVVPGDKSNVLLGQLNWVLNQNAFLDLRVNHSSYRWEWLDREPNDLARYDLFLSTRRGTHSGYYIYTPKTSFNLSLTYFLDNFLGGNHEIKLGGGYETSKGNVSLWGNVPYWLFTYNDEPWGLQNVAPYMGMFFGWTIGAENGDTIANTRERRFGVYVQDSITIKNRLTLNLGLRYDEDRGDSLGGEFNPVGASDPVLPMLAPQWFTPFTYSPRNNVFVWKFLSPRVGVVFDPIGDGKTSLRASWALYQEYLMGQNNPFANTGGTTFITSLWLDLNANGIIEPTDFFIPTNIPPTPDQVQPDDVIDPNLKVPYSSEFSVGISREIGKDLSVSISYIYKKKHRVFDNVEKLRGYTPDSEWWIPYTTAEPGWDGQFGTADDGEITVYGVKAGAPQSFLWWTNPEGAERKYQALQFVISKRMSNRWQMVGSITWSKYEGNIGAGYFPTSGGTDAFDTPNWYVNRYGRLDFDRPILIKLQGSFILPYDFMFSYYYSYSSGIPWARTLSVQLPYNPGLDPSSFGQFIDVNAEKPGERRMSARNNLDMRLEKNFNIGSFGRLGIFIDVINTLGETYYEIDQDPGGFLFNNGFFLQYPTVGQYTRAEGRRIFKLSVRFTF